MKRAAVVLTVVTTIAFALATVQGSGGAFRRLLILSR